MNILLSCDENYLRPLRTMLYSLFINNPGEDFDIYLIHKDISENDISSLKAFIKEVSSDDTKLFAIKIDSLFEDAKVNFYYTEEMYYRLLAYKYLPKSIEKILYLDPDILILNPLRDLYHMDLGDNFFAAATHSTPTVQPANVARLSLSSGFKDIENYYNSGVLMINLEAARASDLYEKEVLSYIENSRALGLIMPDQDLLNVVFRNSIIKIDEIKYNYDSRRYLAYKFMDKKIDLAYVVENTSILHFCGKKKPWQREHSPQTFTSLYRYFWTRAERIGAKIKKE